MHPPFKQKLLADKRPLPLPSAYRLLRCASEWVRGLLVTLLLGSLQAYKLLLSPLLGSNCRFHPSCSSYAQQSIGRFGPVVGGWLAVKRLLRCGPWHEGGIDEVPVSVSRDSFPEVHRGCDCDTSSLTNFDSPISKAVNRNRA